MTQATPLLTADTIAASAPSLKLIDTAPADRDHAASPEVKDLEPPQPRKRRPQLPA